MTVKQREKAKMTVEKDPLTEQDMMACVVMLGHALGEIDRLRIVLTRIAEQDYRGNACWCRSFARAVLDDDK